MHVDKLLLASGDFIVWGKKYRTISITVPFQTWYRGKLAAVFMSLFVEKPQQLFLSYHHFFVRAKSTDWLHIITPDWLIGCLKIKFKPPSNVVGKSLGVKYYPDRYQKQNNGTH